MGVHLLEACRLPVTAPTNIVLSRDKPATDLNQVVRFHKLFSKPPSTSLTTKPRNLLTVAVDDSDPLGIRHHHPPTSGSSPRLGPALVWPFFRLL